MDNTWQVFQWFDTEPLAIERLNFAASKMVCEGRTFNVDFVQGMLLDCPIAANVDLCAIVDQFNDMLQNLH
ncbi:hypothetical protein G3489_19535 [Shewanella baltica]|uniref:hypothetical protein n=1 Tax=Shewanella baltica TaxID=62322 RepID=UPI00217E54A6|nr:hypothetical protein [Shewanella baltica]MCS6271870.1 hypothetical protein [Shewanella baltica]